MACPFCLSDQFSRTGSCEICLHPLKPDWVSLPPHKLSPKTRLELVVADCRHILGWLSGIYKTLAESHPDAGWDRKHSIARSELGSIPSLLEDWAAGMADVPPEPEEAVCLHLECGILPPYNPLIQELRKGNMWRFQASMLSRTQAAKSQIAELQAEIVQNTWWGLYGSVFRRQQVLVSIVSGYDWDSSPGTIIPPIYRN